MNGLTATGITVGICAGIWQLISSQVGLDPRWGLLGTIGFVAFCSFYAAGGGKEGFVKSLFVNYTGAAWAFLAAMAAGGLTAATGMSSFWASVITTVPFSAVIVWQGRFFPHRVYSRRLSWHDAVFRLRDELAGDAAGFFGRQRRGADFRIYRS